MFRLFITILLFGAALFLALTYVRPEWRHSRALGQELGEAEEVGREFDELIADRDRLLETVNSVSQTDLTRLNRMLSRDPDAADFLVTLETLATDSGVALQRVDLASTGSGKSGGPEAGAAPGQPRPTAGPGTPSADSEGAGVLNFSMQIFGSYDVFKKFLDGLEKNPRLIDIGEITFSAGSKAAEGLGITIRAKTYYQL